MRAVVIGAGIVGLSVALSLSSRGIGVTVVDAGPILDGASSRGLAWANASNKLPHRYFQLNAAGVRAHARLSKIATTPWFHASGTVTSQSYRASLGDLVEMHRDWGYSVQRGHLSDYLEIGLNSCYGSEPAVFYPDEGWVDIEAFRENVIKNLADTQGNIIEQSRVVSLVPVKGRYYVGMSGCPDLEADIVVNAAGAGAPAVAALLGRYLPMRNRWGIVAQVETPVAQLGHVLMHCLIDIRPGLGRMHFLHNDVVDATLAEDPVGTDVGPQLMELLDRAQQLHSAFDGAVVRGHKVGLRPIPIDNLPVIGNVTTLPGYYEAVTHSGLTLGPVIGEILATQILRMPCDEFDLSAFSPDRFAN